MENINILQEILREAQQLPARTVEKNIFSLGGRGHYENPTSDLLAFFLDPHEAHGFGDLVLRSLYSAIDRPTEITRISGHPQREVETENKKRIDILIECPNHVVVIENKIRHGANNPFEDYEQHLKAHFQERRRIFILLSVRDERRPTEQWVTLTYRKFLEHIRNNFGKEIFGTRIHNTKWMVLFREFLLNIEQEYGNDPMINDELDFTKKNYPGIYKLTLLHKSYIQEMGRLAMETIDEILGTGTHKTVEDWTKDAITAVRFSKLPNCNGQAEIVLMLNSDGSFQVRVFADRVEEKGRFAIRREPIDASSWTKENSISQYFDYTARHEIEKATADIEDAAKRLSTFFCSLVQAGTA